jgi:hypothetical protein
VAQQFIYRVTTIATSMGDVTRPVAIEDHSGNEKMRSSTRGYYDSYIYSAIVN